jgi:hypothetical protein
VPVAPRGGGPRQGPVRATVATATRTAAAAVGAARTTRLPRATGQGRTMSRMAIAGALSARTPAARASGGHTRLPRDGTQGRAPNAPAPMRFGSGS